MACAPPQISGTLYKQSPSPWRWWNPWDRRYFEIKDRRMRWWQCEEHTRMEEVYVQTYMKGVIDLLHAEIELDANSDTVFKLVVGVGHWSSAASPPSKEPREFVFDSQESEHCRDMWVRVIRQHTIWGEPMMAKVLVDASQKEVKPTNISAQQEDLARLLAEANKYNAALKQEHAIMERRLQELEAMTQDAVEARKAAESRAQELEALNKTKRRSQTFVSSSSDDEAEIELMAAPALRRKRRALITEVDEDQKRLIEEVQEVIASSLESDISDMTLDVAKGFRERLSTVLRSARASCIPEVYLADAEQRRRKIHNHIEDLKGSIRVFCRVRPLSRGEAARGDTEVTTFLDTMTIGIARSGEKVVPFSFDAVFAPGTQEEVFEDCKDLVQSAIDGYNVTIFAYGQTGAGKTFTMYGGPGNQGTAPRTINELFKLIGNNKDRCNYVVSASMLELYRNELIDLLSKGANTAPTKVDLKLDKDGLVRLGDVIEVDCPDAPSLFAVLARGNNQRTVAATAMNIESSRSHLIIIIKIVSVSKDSQATFCSKLLLCDLAGSECFHNSGATAEMLKESHEINKALTALGDVIEALTKKQNEVPYRNHRLTQLMRDSLGGSSKTLMCVNVSPASSSMDETLSSLKYATRAKQVRNSVSRSTTAGSSSD